MKKLSRIAALLAASAMLFGAVSCSDGSDSGSDGGSGGGDPAPAGATEYVWAFDKADLLSVPAWSADAGQSNTTPPSGTEYAKVKLDADATYESTPAGLTMAIASGSQFNKVSPNGAVAGAISGVTASKGSIEPLGGTVFKVSVKGPFTVSFICASNGNADKTDRYAFIKVAGAEVAAPTKATNTVPAAGQEVSFNYTGTDTVDVEIGGTGITRFYDLKISTANGNAGTKVAGEVKSLGSFTAATDNSTLNDVATLGLEGASAASSAESVATVAISDGKIAITSVAAGTATITVSDACDPAHTATIAVTVGSTGTISIGKITKYTPAAPAETTNYTKADNVLTAVTAIEYSSNGTDYTALAAGEQYTAASTETVKVRFAAVDANHAASATVDVVLAAAGAKVTYKLTPDMISEWTTAKGALTDITTTGAKFQAGDSVTYQAAKTATNADNVTLNYPACIKTGGSAQKAGKNCVVFTTTGPATVKVTFFNDSGADRNVGYKTGTSVNLVNKGAWVEGVVAGTEKTIAFTKNDSAVITNSTFEEIVVSTTFEISAAGTYSLGGINGIFITEVSVEM